MIVLAHNKRAAFALFVCSHHLPAQHFLTESTRLGILTARHDGLDHWPIGNRHVNLPVLSSTTSAACLRHGTGNTVLPSLPGTRFH
jgi:hypothetical protein